MTFPILKENELDSIQNNSFSKCPNLDCKKKEVIEIAKPKENKIYDYCLNCGYKKDKGQINYE